jgi:hypothetical protein
MVPLDAFSGLFGDGRGPLSVSTRAQPSGNTTAMDGQSRPGVSGSGLPFQAVSGADALQAIRTACRALGRAPTRSEYEQWRVQTARNASAQAAALNATPHSAAIIRVFGNWWAALDGADV